MPLSLEWQLLCACLRTVLACEGAPQLLPALTNTQVDWSRAADLACQEGIAPLLYHCVQQMGAVGDPPPAATDVLQNAYYLTALRNTLLYRELHEVLQVLQECGRSVIVLKGAALAELIYPNRALRPMSDVDLLVRKDDLARVESTLGAMGYRLEIHPKGKEWPYDHHYHVGFVKNEETPSELRVEMHWHLQLPSTPFTIDIEGIWERAVPATIAGVAALVLSPEDSLLYLCWHICKHKLTGGFRAFCDIGVTLRHYEHSLDWDQVCTRAAQWQIAPYVFLPLQLVKELLGATVPEQALAALTPQDFDVQLLEWAKEEIFEDRATSPLFPAMFHLWQGPRFTDRVALVRQLLAPTLVARYYAVSPASPIFYWYYLVRLKDLLWRYGPVLWRLVRRDQHLTARAEDKSQLKAWLAPFTHDQSPLQGCPEKDRSRGAPLLPPAKVQEASRAKDA